MRCIVALKVRSGVERAPPAFAAISTTSIRRLSCWRNGDNMSGRAFATWAEGRGMSHAALTDGRTANGVFLASSDPFAMVSATPSVEDPGCLMLAQFGA
jgi:hypothetical protein